jgi:hypothetical protein
MERRALLRSLGLMGLGAVAAACGGRTTPPDAAEAPVPREERPPVDPDPVEGDVEAELDAGVDAEPEPEPQPEPDPTPEPESDPANEAEPARTVAVICRDALGLAAAGASAATHRLDRLTLHHTGVRLPDASVAPTHLRRHQKHHRDQGWPDIAYHYAVDLAGNVYELRDPGVPGDTFTDYDTTGHLQVVCEGNFEQQEPTDELLLALSELFAGLATTHGLSPATLDTHRSYVPTTACPGDGLLARLEEIRAAVVSLQQQPGVEVGLQCGADARQRVARIEAG